MNQRDRLAWVVIILSVALLAGLRWQRGTAGSDFPERGITLVVPYAAGGGTDLLSRNLARAAEPLFGRTVTVNNITGGVGAVGFTAGLLAPPDGYTVTAVTFELVSLPLQGLVPFTHEDFDLLMRTNMDPAALTVGADFPADTLEEFLALARTRETPLSLGNSGFGSVWHLAGALFAQTTDITGRFIPYSGAAPAITALVGGHVDAVTVSLGEVRRHPDEHHSLLERGRWYRCLPPPRRIHPERPGRVGAGEQRADLRRRGPPRHGGPWKSPGRSSRRIELHEGDPGDT